MLNKTKNSLINKILIAVIGAIPLTIIIVAAVINGWQFVFWLYMGILVISTFIDRWSPIDQKNKFQMINEHLFHACAITLFLTWFVLRLFD